MSASAGINAAKGRRIASAAAGSLGIDPRGFAALTKALIVMDLRGQHYAKATATKPHYLISPLFWVVGQCFTVSAVASLVFFARVDVFFYAFIGLSLSMLVIATTVLVEFNEVVFDPCDLEIISPRPVSLRTYSAARVANLLFYVGLMFVALNLFPAVLGAGLRDAGWWYAPAYLVASLAGNLAVVAAVIFVLAAAGTSPRLESLKELLAWTQILLILVVGYGAQLMFRDGTQRVLVWGAFPPPWVEWLPPAMLARFVEAASTAPASREAWTGGLLIGVALASVAGTAWRVGRLYRSMQPIPVRARVRRMPAAELGGVGGRFTRHLTRTADERCGFRLACVLLARDANLKMRCLLPLNAAVAVVILGLCTGQFANPLRSPPTPLAILPELAVYLIALSVPPIIFQLGFHRDAEAAWILRASPIEHPVEVARGACKAVMVWVVAPLCLAFAATLAIAWGDPVAALVHAALAFGLSWPMALAALWLMLPEIPFSLPYARGASFGPIALPLAALGIVGMNLLAAHYLWAQSSFFWLAAGCVCLLATAWIGHRADRRLRKLWEAPL